MSVFYLSKPGYGNGYSEIVAYDNCRALDRIFDTSDYYSEDEDCRASAVADSIAYQCGFGGVANYTPKIKTIPFKYLKDKTCRSILMMLSEANCGCFFCNNIGQLEFKGFGDITDVCGIDENCCANFRIGAVKGPISVIQVSNPVSGENYELGYGTGFVSKLKVEGKLISPSAAEEIYSDVLDKEYRAFACDRIKTELLPNALCGFLYDGKIYNATSIVTDITPSGFYSRVKSPVISEDRFDYVGTLEYTVADRIMQERLYGCSVISTSGLRFADENTSYGFTAKSGGLTSYDGVMTSSKEAEKISVDKSSGTVTVTYSDGHIYKYSASVTENSTGYDITDEKEEWT